MSIICRQCGFENPDGAKVCEICAEPLEKVKEKEEPEKGTAYNSESGFYVMCPESGTKTRVPNDAVTSFFCEGCKKIHEIDGFIWRIEKRDLQTPKTPEDRLFLEDTESHELIGIEKPGGVLGRFGQFGMEFFKKRRLLTVSREHLRFEYNYGTWTVSHMSKTNRTVYDGMELEELQPTVIENGKILNLADSVSFIVRIG